MPNIASQLYSVPHSPEPLRASQQPLQSLSRASLEPLQSLSRASYAASIEPLQSLSRASSETDTDSQSEEGGRFKASQTGVPGPVGAAPSNCGSESLSDFGLKQSVLLQYVAGRAGGSVCNSFCARRVSHLTPPHPILFSKVNTPHHPPCQFCFEFSQTQ